MSSNQYKSKIRDYSDLDMEFVNLEKSSRDNNQLISSQLEILVSTLYRDIVQTRTEADKRNLDAIEVIFDDRTNELLSNIGGLSTVFDKAKGIVLRKIEDSTIDERLKDELLKAIQSDIRRKLDSYRKKQSQDGQDDKNVRRISVESSPSEKALNDFSRKILQNQDLVNRISQNIRRTISGQDKIQKKNIINFLTGNKYKELALRIKKDNISRAQTILGTQKKSSIFRKISIMSKTRLGKLKSPKTIFKMFKVKRQKLNKRGFMGLYNQYVYKELMRRVDEFNNVLDFKKKMSKALLKSVLKWGGGVLVSGIDSLLGFGWRMLKSAVKQIFNITKAVGKMGMTILKRVKNFLFTPIGMYVIGFFSGIIYKAVIEPLYFKFKAWFDLVLKPLKRFLGLDEDEDVTIEKLRNQCGIRLKEILKNDIENNDGPTKVFDSIRKLDNFFVEVENEMRNIDMFMNGGGWKRKVGGVVSGSAGTLGTLIGMGIGSLICPGLGTWIGGAIGGVLGGFAAAFTADFVSRLPKSDDEMGTASGYLHKMRSKWMNRVHDVRDDATHKTYNRLQMKKRYAESKKEESDDILKDLIRKRDMNLSESDRKSLEKEISIWEDKKRRYDEEIEEANKDIEKLTEYGIQYNEDEQEAISKIKEKLNSSNKEIYFDIDDFQDMGRFWNNALRGRFQKFAEIGKDSKLTERQTNVIRIKKHALMTAMNKYSMGELTFDSILPYAKSYAEEMGKRKLIESKIRYGSEKDGDIRYVIERKLDMSEYRGEEDIRRAWESFSHIYNNPEYKPYKNDLYRYFISLYFRSFSLEGDRMKTMGDELLKAARQMVRIQKQMGREAEEKAGNLQSNDADALNMAKHRLREEMAKVVEELNKDAFGKGEKEELLNLLKTKLGLHDSKEVAKEISIGEKLDRMIRDKRMERDRLQDEVDRNTAKRDRMRNDMMKHTDEGTKKYVEKTGFVPTVLVVPQKTDDPYSANDESRSAMQGDTMGTLGEMKLFQ